MNLMSYIGPGIALLIALAVLYGFWRAWCPDTACPACRSLNTDMIRFALLHSPLYGCLDCRHEWRNDEVVS